MSAAPAGSWLAVLATLGAPSLHTIADHVAAAPFVVVTPRLMLELVLLSLLFASLVSTLMAVRYVRKAWLLYGFGLRQLVLVAPVVAALLHPFAGPVAALAVAWVLFALDRVGH
ncbi:MAG: hypothetical protein KA795_14665 [Burkholderiaceae bacterium]|nr:hypothetical protein [Burkholderiaceae bacterium]